MTTVLITGANRGVGLELARVFARAGSTVIACCRRPEAATALAALAEGRDIEVASLAVDSAESVEALAQSLAGRRIDTLINNAGILGPPSDRQSTMTMDFEGWAETLAVNTLGPVRVMQALMPNLRLSPTPKVVSITSQLGALSLDRSYVHAYSSSRAALNKFMRLAAMDLQGDGVIVGLVHPGWVRTDMGGAGADISAEESAAGILEVVERMTLENTGGFWKWNGERHEW